MLGMLTLGRLGMWGSCRGALPGWTVTGGGSFAKREIFLFIILNLFLLFKKCMITCLDCLISLCQFIQFISWVECISFFIWCRSYCRRGRHFWQLLSPKFPLHSPCATVNGCDFWNLQFITLTWIVILTVQHRNRLPPFMTLEPCCLQYNDTAVNEFE